MAILDVKPTVKKILEPLFNLMVRVGIDPNILTAMGLGFALLAGYAFFIKEYYIALIFVLLTGLMDILDGGVARAGGYNSDQGAFLDSIADRLGDAAICAGIILSFDNILNQLIGIVLLASSFYVSYIRARGEGLGLSLNGIGMMERAERITFLFFTALFGGIFGLDVLIYLIYILTGLTLITAGHRFFAAYKALNNSYLSS